MDSDPGHTHARQVSTPAQARDSEQLPGRGWKVRSPVFFDRTLKCRDCAESFLWTAGEQTFYREKGLQNVPVRCNSCRDARKVEMGIRPRAEHRVICADCGSETTVPFIPRQNRPVYCGRCYALAKQAETEPEAVAHASSAV